MLEKKRRCSSHLSSTRAPYTELFETFLFYAYNVKSSSHFLTNKHYFSSQFHHSVAFKSYPVSF